MNNGDHNNDIIYVGFWPRLAASVIDSIAIFIIIIPLIFIFFDGNFISIKITLDIRQMLQSLVPEFGVFVIKYILPAIAIVLFWMFKSATPGKIAIGAEIVDSKTFGKPTNWQLIVRYLGYYVSALPFLLGLIWIAFDARKQGWHDKLAGTVVIQKR